jgi:hypothetical protein
LLNWRTSAAVTAALVPGAARQAALAGVLGGPLVALVYQS